MLKNNIPGNSKLSIQDLKERREVIPNVAQINTSASVISGAIEYGKAFQILADQPVSLIGLEKSERDAVVISALADKYGNEHVLSKFGDDVWNFSPDILAVNRSEASKIIIWSQEVPTELIDDAKIAVYCSIRQGRNGIAWAASTAAAFGPRIDFFLKYLSGIGVGKFSDLRPAHISEYINQCKGNIEASTIYGYLHIVDLAWSFSKELDNPMPDHPFWGKTLYDAVGKWGARSNNSGKSGKTPVIPRSVQKKIWLHCEATLDQAESIFLRRDGGEVDAMSAELIAIRDSALYQLQICTGMRNSESTGVVNGCWRSEVKKILHNRKVVFHWINTREVKTTGGKFLDYLAPGELFASMEKLQRYAEPLQQRLADEAAWLEAILKTEADAEGLFSNNKNFLENIDRIRRIKEIGKHLMLTVSYGSSDHLGDGTRIDVMTSQDCNAALRRVARTAGAKWKIANHQCRRTFAWNVANSRLGRMGLVFIKWQFKHVSISWTQLYAANPAQEQALYEEFGDAMFESKTELITAWNEADRRLSGGAGKRLMQTRAIPARSMSQLVQATADTVVLRSTGHAWCMSGTRGCHGQGVYDPTMCGGCSQAIIDESQGSRWQMIHLENLRLAAVTDCGPVISEKIRRAIIMSESVLSDLNIPLPSATQALAYEAGEWSE